MNRPYYWYRPSQLAVRLRAGSGEAASDDGGLRLLRTAWGSRVHCWPDPLGNSIARTGTYDLIVAETLARLADPGETVVDAGANVGVMSNLLAHAVGPSGNVISFEPHPLVFRALSANVARWAGERIGPVAPRHAAVSAEAGTLPLRIESDEFERNKGTASLEEHGTGEAIEVRTVRLADELAGPVGVMKLDVEFHELAALRGAEPLLAQGLIRDVLFEEHRPPPTPVTRLLEGHGYTVLGLRQGTLGPLVSTPREAYAKQLWDPPALLATREPQRARARLRRRGWVSLRPRLRGVAAMRGAMGLVGPGAAACPGGEGGERA